MESTPPTGSPPPTQPSTMLPALVVVGALVGFALLLFLANFSVTTTPEVAAGPDLAGDGFKTAGKAKSTKSKVSKRPEASLMVTSPARSVPDAPPDAKNVVLVILSTARKDQFTPYGAADNVTPFLQEISTKGARFKDALTASPFARSAGAALFTGRYPTALDMVVPGAGPETEKVLADGVETLAERLAAAGWRTYGATANFHRNTETGLAQGFDQFRNSQPNGYNIAIRTPGGKLASIAVEMLDKRTEEEAKHPFFLVVDMVDPQGPIKMIPERMKEFDESKPNAAYRSALNDVDTHIKALVDSLDSLGDTLDKNTYLVVIADCGEGLSDPEHHGRAHGVLLYESSVSIPWIVAGPDIPPNRVISGLASSVDLMPTVLGLVGLEPPEGIDGMSFAPQLKGQGDRTTREQAFSDTWWSTANRASIWTERMQCQKDYGSTGITDTFATGCFDRVTDPEFRDLKQDPTLLAALDAWRLEVSAAVTAVAETPAPKDAAEPSKDADEGGDAAEPTAAPEGEEEEEVPEEGEQAG